MNCLEFRRRIALGAVEQDEAMRAHAAGCSSCAAFERRSQRFESALGRVVRVSVPEGLAARVLLRHDFYAARSGPGRRRMLALAASVVLMLAGGGFGWWFAERSHPLAEEVLLFVDTATFAHEADAPVSEQELAAALRPVGVWLERPVGEVTFAGPCVVRGSLAAHLVLRGGSDKITVLLMPEERVSRRAEFHSGARSALLLPSEAGTVAIVAGRGEPLDALARRVLDAVRWST